MTRPVSETLVASPSGRYCDQPIDWRTRTAGFASTAAIFAAMLAAALVTWRVVHLPVQPVSQSLTTVELAPLAAPPEREQEVPPGPEQVEAQASKPVPETEPEQRDLVEPLITLPVTPAARFDVVKPMAPTDPGVPVPRTTAPKSVAAPAASRLSSDARPDWEGLILAHLERFRRYPTRARAARQQGVAHIRFTMNRAGMVLASAVVRKSGSIDLDRAALETLKRAQPLPPIPEDRPDRVELTIPVEFNLR